MSKRLAAMGAPGYSVDDPFKVACMPDKLNEPLKRKKPAIIAVSFMGDIFHDQVPDEFIDKVFGVMALAKQHRFIVLTKRAERMYKYIAGPYSGDGVVARIADQAQQITKRCKIFPSAETFHIEPLGLGGEFGDRWFIKTWPLPNVIGMVTVEDRESYKERVPLLLKTPFAMHGISIEPMLEWIDVPPHDSGGAGRYGRNYGMSQIDWIIAGGESGSGARPMHPGWVRNLRDQCQVAGTPYFFKQWGEWTPGENVDGSKSFPTQCFFDGKFSDCSDDWATEKDHGQLMYRVGKKKAGHLLDGEEWHQMPEGMKL